MILVLNDRLTLGGVPIKTYHLQLRDDPIRTGPNRGHALCGELLVAQWFTWAPLPFEPAYGVLEHWNPCVECVQVALEIREFMP